KRIDDIRKILQVREKLEFLDLFQEENKDFLIVTFLSVLTMSKNEEILLTQEDNFKPIMIERRKGDE
ncbi:MAG: segregation/condensation protein A, partial [Bacilli bacterium]|nr:segregation/condensation protein A [Bacilli bacterium]